MVAGLGTAQGRIEVNTKPAQASLKGLNKTMQNVARRSQSGFNKVAKAAKVTAVALGAIGGAAAVALGVKAVKLTSDFRSALNQAGTVAKATAKEYEAMQASALRLGKETSFSAGEAADAFLELARSGFSAGQAIEGVDAVVTLAAAATTDMGTAAEVASDLMTAFKLSASDLDGIVNSMAGATLNSAQSFEDLIYSTRYAAPTFANMGFSMENLATATAALAAEGIKGSQAGTTLRAVFARMVKPTGEAKDLMNELGLSVANADGTFKPFEQVVGEVNTALSGMTDSQRQAALTTLFGMRAMDGASILFRNTTDDISALNEKVNAQGQAAKAAEATMAGLGGALLYFKGTMESTLISALIPFEGGVDGVIRSTADLISAWGTKFAGAATKVIDLVTTISTNFKALQAALAGDGQNLEGPMAGIAGILKTLGEGAKFYAENVDILTPLLAGLAVVVVASVAPALVAMAASIAAMAVAAAPFLLIGAAVAGFVVLVGKVKEKHGDIAAYFVAMAGGLTVLAIALALFTGLSAPIILIVAGLAALALGVTYVVQNWDTLKAKLEQTQVFQRVQEWVQNVIDTMRNLFTITLPGWFRRIVGKDKATITIEAKPSLFERVGKFLDWAWPVLPGGFILWKWPKLAAAFTQWAWPKLSEAFTGWQWPTMPALFTGWRWPKVPLALTNWRWPGMPAWLRNWKWPSLKIKMPSWLGGRRDRDRDPDPRNPMYRGHALGTMAAPGGWSWVGERGPELMQIPQGTQVQSHPTSMQTARQEEIEPVQVTVVANEGEDSVSTWMAFRQYQFAGE